MRSREEIEKDLHTKKPGVDTQEDLAWVTAGTVVELLLDIRDLLMQSQKGMIAIADTYKCPLCAREHKRGSNPHPGGY